jgi:hypothetical protein
MNASSSLFICNAFIDWLRDGLLNLGLIKSLFISMLTFRVGLISGLVL